MERVILHIGYPKTATTTLQDRWFGPAHGDGLIEFFGKFTGEEPGRPVKETRLRDVIEDGSQLSDTASLSADRVNVFSDERMTLTNVLKQHSPYPEREQIPPADIPEILSAVTEDISDVTILMTVRNQPSIINSTYAHYHYYLAGHAEYGTWEQYLDTILSSERVVFDFDQLLAQYESQFGDSIEVLLFEEFVNERDRFTERLATILDVSPEALRESAITEAHENKKEKDEEKYVKEMGSDFSVRLRNTIDSVYSTQKAENLVGKIIGEGRKDRLKERVFLTEREIPRPTDQQVAALLDRFESGNERLHTEFGVDRDKLVEYGYLQ